MIAPHVSNSLGPSLIFYFVTASHITTVIFLDFFPEAFDITTCKFSCQYICMHIFFILQFLILGVFQPCPRLDFMKNSWARLGKALPTKMVSTRFVVLFGKVIIPARHMGNTAFLYLWNTNFISIWQAMHNVLNTLHLQNWYGCGYITAYTKAINKTIKQLYVLQHAVYSVPVMTQGTPFNRSRSIFWKLMSLINKTILLFLLSSKWYTHRHKVMTRGQIIMQDIYFWNGLVHRETTEA